MNLEDPLWFNVAIALNALWMPVCKRNQSLIVDLNNKYDYDNIPTVERDLVWTLDLFSE